MFKGEWLILCLWYCASASVLITNKYILAISEFKYPLLMTLVQMTSCVFISQTLFYFKQKQKTSVCGKKWCTKLVPLSLLFIGNIVLSNISLQYISASFMQVVRSTVPVFTFLIQQTLFANNNEKKFDVIVFLLLSFITSGVMLASWTEIEFHWLGFCCALCASIVVSLQNNLATLYFKNQMKMDSVNMVYYTSSIASVVLAPLFYLFEYQHFRNSMFRKDKEFIFYFSINLTAVLLLNFSVFNTFLKINTLAFSVAVNLKTTIFIIVSILFFKTKVTLLNTSGIAITLVGCYLYKYYSAKHKFLHCKNKKNQ